MGTIVASVPPTYQLCSTRKNSWGDSSQVAWRAQMRRIRLRRTCAWRLDDDGAQEHTKTDQR